MPRDARQYEGRDQRLRERARQLSPHQLRLEMNGRRTSSTDAKSKSEVPPA